MLVSHDRYFLNKVVDYIYELEEGKLIKYYGNYDYYRSKKEEFLQDKELEAKDSKEKEYQSDYHRLKEEARQERKRQNRIAALEESIEEKKEK